MIKCNIVAVKGSENPKYDKRNSIIEEFLSIDKDCEINFEIAEAVKPNDFNVVDGKVIYDGESFDISKKASHLPIFYFANYLSHYKIWKEMGPTFVLEDDIIYDIDVFNRLPTLIEKFEKIKMPNKILYLQSSCPWREGLPDKQYQYLIDYSEDFYMLHSQFFNDVSGNAAYYMNIDQNLLATLKRETGATDGVLDELLKNNSLLYFIPKDFDKWFKLNRDVQ
jgi:GR25 family glycosyltransferase involved in LPS biosynthesis